MPYLDSANYELPYQTGSATSQDAARAAQPWACQQGLAVLAYVRECLDGCTQKDISRGLALGRPSVAARVHALEQAGKLVKTDRRRDGCSVYRYAKS